MSWKIKSGDTVVLIAGAYKGHVGKVLKVNHDFNQVVVSGAAFITKHQKPENGQPGQKIERENGVHVSNVALFDPKANCASKVGFRYVKNGEKSVKVRFFKKTGEGVPHAR